MNSADPYHRAVQELQTLGHCSEVTTKLLLHEIEQRRPPADSDTPIDDEWLLTVGFLRFAESSTALHYNGPGGSQMPLCRDFKGDWWLNRHAFPLMEPKTRADIRLMIQFMERF